ncbi:MAG: hypothetical protein CL946_09415 [Ectothiorhodospiraceae bacterium]|nr:hypothetical protein [Ectothiorhodospiraceae bacterium]
MENQLNSRLNAIEEKLEDLSASQRDVLTFQQAAKYLDFSPSFLYKLTSQGRIPHSKPNGKRIYFDRRELDRWLLQNPVKTQDEIEADALSFTKSGKRS